jgi:hypothetical protein
LWPLVAELGRGRQVKGVWIAVLAIAIHGHVNHFGRRAIPYHRRVEVFEATSSLSDSTPRRSPHDVLQHLHPQSVIVVLNYLNHELKGDEIELS